MDFDDLRNIVCFDLSKDTPSSKTDMNGIVALKNLKYLDGKIIVI